jgi:NitT/TauT family transport system substrate-binding protein
MKQRIWKLAFGVAAIAAFSVGSASAETRVVRLAKQYGIAYLPLAIIQDKNLIEAEGKKLGLDLKTEWVRFTGGPPMNEALISGNLDFASGGSGPLITAWARTKDNIKIRGICALNSMPQWLNTTNPNVKTIISPTKTGSPFPPCGSRYRR